MRVLALNCSPHMEKGATAAVLRPFLDGLRDGGAEVELVIVNRLSIHHCLGDYACWTRTPGQCRQQDDMQSLYPGLRSADLVVFATPVYSDGVSGLMKDIMDRSIASMEPGLDVKDDHCHHPVRPDAGRGGVVVVSTCGLWEMDNFGPLLAHVEAWCRTANRPFVGALLRPHGSALLPGWHVACDEVGVAAREAGRQLATTGRMSPETLEAVSRPLMSRDQYIARMNEQFRVRAANSTRE